MTLRSAPSGAEAPAPSDLAAFPLDLPVKRLEGGGTVLTYKLPPQCERVEYLIKSNGRPLKGKVQLWLGPLRQTHEMVIDSEDGNMTPLRSILKFKKGDPTLKFSTSSSMEFPMIVGVRVPSDERAKELAAFTQKLWDTSPKTVIQGGDIQGGRGAVRTFPIPSDVDSVQLLFWSIDTGKKSLKAKIEVLQGPNNRKQTYDLQCGGGSQPYHTVIETPGEGVSLRIFNKKYLEDGLFQVAVVPYTIGGMLNTGGSSLLILSNEGTGSTGRNLSTRVTPLVNSSSSPDKRWWEKY